MILSGIPDPLRQLPDMHAILDVAEVLMTESMSKDELEAWWRKAYRQSRPAITPSGTAPEERPDPPGFDVEDQQVSFAAFQKMAAGFE